MICPTKKVQDFLGLKNLEPLTEETNNIFHVNLLTFEHRKLLIFTHYQTGYVVLLYGVKKNHTKNLTELFKEALKESLLADCFLEEVVNMFIMDLSLDFKKSSDRKMISMTTSAYETVRMYPEYLNKGTLAQSILSRRVNQLLNMKVTVPYKEMIKHLKIYHQAPIIYQAYKVKITIDLEGDEVSRELLVPSHNTLDDLHQIIQKAFGWRNYHLYEFNLNDSMECYGIVEYFNEFEQTHFDSRLLTVKEAFSYSTDITYTYDFGDNWIHEITVLDFVSSNEIIYPKCLSYHNEPIPEDVGGVSGYHSFKDIINHPNNEDYQNAVEWLEFIQYHKMDLPFLNKSLEYGFSIEHHYNTLENPNLYKFYFEKREK